MGPAGACGRRGRRGSACQGRARRAARPAPGRRSPRSAHRDPRPGHRDPCGPRRPESPHVGDVHTAARELGKGLAPNGHFLREIIHISTCPVDNFMNSLVRWEFTGPTTLLGRTQKPTTRLTRRDRSTTTWLTGRERSTTTWLTSRNFPTRRLTSRCRPTTILSVSAGGRGSSPRPSRSSSCCFCCATARVRATASSVATTICPGRGQRRT